MARLPEEHGRLRVFDNDLSRKALEHIKVTAGGKLAATFLTGKGAAI